MNKTYNFKIAGLPFMATYRCKIYNQQNCALNLHMISQGKIYKGKGKYPASWLNKWGYKNDGLFCSFYDTTKNV